MSKTLAFDTETRGLDSFNPEHSAFLATWATDEGEWHADLSKPDETDKFRRAIDEAGVVVGHNLGYDRHHTIAALGFDPCEGKVIHDTEIMSRVLFPSGQGGAWGQHSLKHLATVHLRADAADPEEAIKEMAKSIGLRTIKQTGAYFAVWTAYPEIMETYARQDARYTYDLYQKFIASPEYTSLRSVYDMEMRVLPVLWRAEDRGVAVDQAEVARLKAKYITARDEVRTYLEAELGAEALTTEAGLTDALMEIGVPLYRKTATGKLATHQYALGEFEKDFPQIAALSEYRTLERFLSTYIGALDGRDVVHPSFQPIGAWTGRMSCRSPNLQNFPKRAGKEVRGALVPRPGHSFVVADYEGIEARLLAYYLGDAGYRQLYRDGHDPHAYMAAQIYGGRVEDYAKGSAGEDRRGTAKNTTFAISYGAGAPRVSDMNGITKEEAKVLIAKIKSSLPNYYKLNKRIRDKIERDGYVSTIAGRKQLVNKEKSYIGMSGLIQGSAADLMKLGVIAVDEAVRPFGGVPVLFVHDECVIEVPTERAAACQVAVDDAMVTAWALDPPLSVESSVTAKSYAHA